MKKFTLLAGIALLAGNSAFAVEEINGLKISTDTEKVYYRISNMRAQRMSYITGHLYGEDGYTEEDIIGDDDAIVRQNVNLPEFLPNGEPTPEIFSFPYMGLCNLNDNWWVGFSAQEDVMSPYTTYWYFTKGDRDGSVYIHNAVMDGTVKRASQSVEGVDGISRRTMGFDTEGQNRYYVIPAMEGPSSNGELTGMGINDQVWADELTLNDEQKAQAFALCIMPTYDANSSTCLDMNNYISYTMQSQQTEDGEPVVDENGDPVYNYYGFAGVDRTWSPIRTTGGETNINHYANNGTLFFVDERPEAEADDAIKKYRQKIIEVLRQGAIKGGKQKFAEAISTMEGWANVPALWSNETALRAIIDYCANWNGEGLDTNSVVDLATRLKFEDDAQKLADKKLAEAAALVGTGAIITLQNQLAFRDIEDCANMEEPEIEATQLGNAYINADGEGSVIFDGTYTPTSYTGIVPSLTANEKSQWTLIPVPGTATFLLYNEATQTYIRQYKDMYEFADGENEFGEANSCRDFSWATTANKEEAAAFNFIGCADPNEDQTLPTEDEEIVLSDYDVDTDITNNVRLQSTYTVTTPAESEGEDPTVETVYTNIHRASGGSNYTFVNYTPTKNWWYADTNAFKVALVKAGGISEITAENIKNNAVYDLQGRRVAKAGKGLFIINGVKTIVR